MHDSLGSRGSAVRGAAAGSDRTAFRTALGTSLCFAYLGATPALKESAAKRRR